MRVPARHLHRYANRVELANTATKVQGNRQNQCAHLAMQEDTATKVQVNRQNRAVLQAAH